MSIILKSIIAKNGGGGGGGITDVVNGYAILKEQQRSYFASYNYFPTIFNKDRSIVLRYTQSPTQLRLTRVNAADVFSGEAAVSVISLAFGQSISYQPVMQDIATASKDDDFLLLAGVNGNTNIFRIAVNPATYALGAVVSFNTGIANPKKPEIIDANNYVNYSGQNVQVFNFNGSAIALSKTIAVGFDIIRVNACKDLIVAIGLNKVVFINPETENVVYSEDLAMTLSDVFCADSYAFIKTLSSTVVPMLVYNVSSGFVTKLNMAVTDEFPTGAVKSLINVVKDDNTIDKEQYIAIYHTDNVSNIVMSVDVTNKKNAIVNVGADTLTGTPQIFKATFLTGNRIIFNSYTSGTPGPGFTQVYKYEYGNISLKYKGKQFKIVGLG